MQQRQTARGAASAKQALPEAREPVHAAKEAKAAAAEEEEVVELLSSDDEAAPLQVQETGLWVAGVGLHEAEQLHMFQSSCSHQRSTWRITQLLCQAGAARHSAPVCPGRRSSPLGSLLRWHAGARRVVKRSRGRPVGQRVRG